MGPKFRIRIAATRRVTFPKLVLNALCISAGDILEIAIRDGVFIGRRGLEPELSGLFAPGIVRKLREREQAIANRGFEVADAAELIPALNRAKKYNRKVAA